MKNTKKMSLKRAIQIAKIKKFGLEAELDDMSIQQAWDELRKATNLMPESVTLKVAHEVVFAEMSKQKASVRDERPVRTPDEPPIPASPYVTASWRDMREWK
jgi:hypothetical protein